jgi:hypothetical protein
MRHRLGSSVVLAVVALVAPAVHAVQTEFRDYRVKVDGKDAGHTRIVIARHDDGSMVMTAQVNVRINQIIFTYQFNNQTTEIWKNGRMVQLRANTTENGKKTDATGAADGDLFRFRINGKERTAPGHVWSSSFWKLLDAKYHNKAVPILEADSGKEYVGNLQYVGTESLQVANQQMKCYHFRITGGPSTIDLWFDPYYFLVRQEFVESGHRTQVDLVNIQRQ